MQHVVRKRSQHIPAFFKQLARFGCIATGIVYVFIGVIALLSLMRLKHGGADEASLLRFLEDVPLGNLLNGIVLLGMVAYIIWRFYEAFNDPYEYGNRLPGMLTRIITAFSAISDALIAWPALESLLGMNTALKDGEPTAQRQSYAQWLHSTAGVWLVATIGLVTTITAIVQFVYAFREAYEERIDFKTMSRPASIAIHGISYAGHAARGIILGIMGFFMLKAAVTRNAQHIVNTDKAFDFIGDDVSHALFAAVAAGTICYGFFMLVMGYCYDFRKGK